MLRETLAARPSRLRTKNQETETKTHPHDPFPSTLLKALYIFATTPTETSGTCDRSERSSKRRRYEQIESVPVVRETFTISRPADPLIIGQNSAITCNDAGRYFTFYLDKESLIIRSKANSQCDAFRSMLFLNQNFSDAACAALTVLSHSREDQSQEGALAVWATISLEETNKMHHMHFTLEVQWNTATNINRNTKQRGLSQNIIDVLGEYESSQSFTSQNDNSLLPQVFYEVACMPSHEDFGDLATVPIPGLESTLYPFQSRALQWLLMREGVKYNTINPDGGLQLAVHPSPPKSALPLSFRALYDVNGQRFYLSDLYHIVTRDITPFQEIENGLRGGILAEEMGLGKTVEMISLILTHKRSRVLPNELDIYNGTKIRPAGTTLIVTPDTLQAQWITEFKKHAPGLLVMKYPGMKVWANDKAFNKDHEGESLVARFISQLTNCDVVITTYSVLQAELHYAMAPPERSMRYERQHERHISPLVQIGWWRICLDEAQQIDSGVSSAARVARLIPRVNAWAVTGTPVKNDLNDLWGLLLFLRYDPFASSRVVWNALLKTYQTYFAALFNSISIRHSKRAVRDELELPSQKRFIVTIPFTSIEEHHYQSQFKSLVEKAGLSQQGTPLRADWEKDDPSVVDLMKKALASLRQTILHPELGSASARAVAYRTLAEHLENMIELSEARIKAEQRVYLIHKIQRGKVCEILPRVKEAIRIWEEVLEEVKPIILECREDLRRALEHARREQEKEANNRYDEEKASNEDTLETGKVGECRRRLRLILDVEHRATFHLASGFFQLKSNEDMTLPGSDEYQRLDQRETEGYELAQAIRREVLEDPLIKASKLMGRLKERAESQSFVEIPEIVTSNLHGMESGQIVEDLETLGASLNEQADIIDEWREHVIQLLLKPLVDTEGDEEITGAEYEDSTKVQEHLMVYTRALGAIIGDRQEALSGLVNERISYETTTAERMAKDGEGHAPEKMLELLRIRGYVKPKPHGCSFRRSVAVLRELCTKLRHDASVGSNRARLELQIVTTQLRATQDLLTKQSKAALSLERDLDFFTAAMNARVEFYRQLQSVSDSVAPLSEDHVDVSWNQVYEMNLAGEDQIKVKIQNLESNHRHLLHMREEGGNPNEPCVICHTDDFTLGAITTCGHTFCKECIVYWLRAKHRCPLCKEPQTPAMLSEFNRNQSVLALRQGVSRGPLGSRSPAWSKRTEIYSNISEAKLRAIQNIKLDGPSYSAKIDTLIKHLLWLREEDPGAKSIIFSQFRSFLLILQRALTSHRIGFAAFTPLANKSREIQRFKDDASIECLLMDAKAHSSGLNLVNASHVFLCEPLLNTALELQAIARVDRIGQEHETTVWLYIVEGTVEENIYGLSERRRLAHMGDMTKQKAKAITHGVEVADLEAANSRELEQAGNASLMSKSEEGEVVNKGDLLECLFGGAVVV